MGLLEATVSVKTRADPLWERMAMREMGVCPRKREEGICLESLVMAAARGLRSRHLIHYRIISSKKYRLVGTSSNDLRKRSNRQ